MLNRRATWRLSALAIAFTLAVACSAEIDYKVKVDTAAKTFDVSITIPGPKGTVSVQMPSWMPGAYVYGNFYENVTSVTAVDGQGTALDVAHPQKDIWSVDSPGNGPVTISYQVPERGQRRFADQDSSFLQISGPSTYMCVAGRKLEPCRITFEVPKDWPLMLSLDPDRERNTFDAPNYDTLADAPVSTGSGLIIQQYRQHGKDHYVVLEGAARNEIDRQKVLDDCRFVSAAETDFWGSVPYHRYVWHFIVYNAKDGGGGLEHLGSTQISLSTGIGPRAESVLSHEFFHLWNVKRSRPFVLGPFDYATLPKTGNLWWYEGVTDYYASVLPYRYGEWNRDELFGNLVRNLDAVRGNPARLEISPYQASYRVGEASNGRGNSNGYQISYYNLGWLCGLCLDIEIRSRTGNRHSLDDVARALYNLCKDGKPGIQEGEIRKQCMRFGGEGMGAVYDKLVMTPGELPVEDELAKVGLEVEASEESFTDLGFVGLPSREAHGVMVGRIHAPAEGILEQGDVLTSINGQSLTGNPRDAANTFARVRDAAVAGTPMSLEVLRDGKTVTLSVTPIQGERQVHNVVDDANASPSAKALKAEWLATRKVHE